MVSLGTRRSPEGPAPAPPPAMDTAHLTTSQSFLFSSFSPGRLFQRVPACRARKLLLSFTLEIMMVRLHHRALAPAFAPALRPAGLVQGSRDLSPPREARLVF